MNKTQEIKSIFTLALPLMAAFLAQKGMQLIDSVMMGWIGPQALAAGAMGTSLFFTTLIFYMGTLSTVGIFIVRAKGAQEYSQIQSCLQHGLCLALFLALPGMVLIWFAPHFLTLLGEDPQVIANVKLLLHGLILGFPAYLLFLVYREFIAAFALTHVMMIVALSSIPLTFIVNLILIYGKYGFPALGIAGIGYGGAITMWFMLLCVFLYSRKHPVLKKYAALSSFKFDFSLFSDMLRIGIPSGTLFIFEAGMFLAAVTMLGFFGVDALAAHQIAMQCASIAYSIPFALSMATALRVGHAAGAKNILQAQRFAWLGQMIGIILTGLVALIFALFPNELVSFFLQPNAPGYHDIHELATFFLGIAAIFQSLDGIQSIAIGALRGLKDTFTPMLISIGCYWVIGFGGSYYLAFHTSLGAKGVWCGFTIGIWSIGVILLFRLVQKFRHEKKKILRQQERNTLV